MNCEDSSSSSSASPSSSSSSTERTSTSGLLSTACSTPTTSAASGKRRAGRKKFRETRHPVYHGVRERNGGRWVCEVREPGKKSRIWLGTFPKAEMAARAHDVAAIALRGEAAAHLNFQDSARALPRARSAAAEDIRRAAVKAAEMFGPSKLTSTMPSSSSVMPAAGESEAAAGASPGQAGAAQDPAATAGGPPPAMFVDEEALFNIPGLLEDMAVGLLLTPPAMQREMAWEREDEGDIVDLSLWTD